MKEKTKAAFEAAIEHGRALEQAELSQRQKQERAMEQFKIAFFKLLKEVVRPSLGEITKLLDSAGWIARTIEEPDGVSFEVYKGNVKGAGGAIRPNITISPVAETSSVRISWASISQASGAEDYPLAEVTEDFVDQKVLEFFQRLSAERMLPV
jgi:hypothetical protein